MRVQYLETILTKPDLDEEGNPVPETGGRSDIFFALHDDDVTGFTITRLSIGARWIEDVLSEMNGNRHLYPSRVQNYCLWDA